MIVSSPARSRGHPGYTETLPCAAESAEPARQLVRTALGAWGLDVLADDGALVVTELVANAARHAQGRSIRVSVSRPGTDAVRVAVADRSTARPAPREAGPYDVGGRGLALVDALSDRWGSDPLPFGKRVWAVLTCKDAD